MCLRLARSGAQHLETNVSINWTGVADVHAVCDPIQNFRKGPQPLQDAAEKLLGILHEPKQVECPALVTLKQFKFNCIHYLTKLN